MTKKFSLLYPDWGIVPRSGYIPRLVSTFLQPGNSQPVPTLPLHIECKDRQQRPLYCNPHYIPWEDDCCPNRYLTRQKRGHRLFFHPFCHLLSCHTISLSMLYECLPVTEMHINIHKRFEDVHNKAQNWNGQERTRKSGFTLNCFKFFFTFCGWKKLNAGGKKYMRWGLRTNSFFFGLTRIHCYAEERIWLRQ